MTHRLRIFAPLVGLFMLLLCGAAMAQDEERLRVGVAGSEPFIVQGANGYKGLSVDIWEKMAIKSGRAFDYQGYASVGEALGKLEAGEIDMVVGPVSITSGRQEKFEFTQPYFSSSLGILSRDEGRTLWGMVKPFFSKTFFIALSIFMVILAVVGFLVWVVERRACDGPFSEGPVKGLGNGIWLALVTMTTVGYGDLAPKTVMGRVVLGGWMVIALLSATSLLAGLAGTIAMSGETGVKIETTADLSGKNIAVIKGSPGEAFVTKHEGRKLYATSLPDAMKLLENKKVNAVVFDRPQLRYYLEGKDELEFRLSPQKYQPQGYGFAFQKGDVRANELNIELLRLQESGYLDDVEMEWFPPLEE
ncbi:transporter substrate-binding domain-containing protein [Oceaniferula spumae]